MSVISIESYRSRETVAVFQHLLERAKRGEFLGAAVAVKTGQGPVEIVFTDLYRRNPASALSTSMRMSTRLNELQDEIDSRFEAP